jgi:hypothetical protein
MRRKFNEEPIRAQKNCKSEGDLAPEDSADLLVAERRALSPKLSDR